VPDGCVDLLWHEGSLFVAGPDVEAARPELPPGTTVIGLRFQPGAAVAWLGLPMSEIVGRQVELAALWGRRASRLAADIGTDDPPAAVLARLQSGLASLAAESFALVITDIVMPDMEGLETIKRIRRGNPALPIIAISGGGSSQIDYLKFARKFGANAALAKPFDPAELLDLATQLIA